jgi:hypothetical protein
MFKPIIALSAFLACGVCHAASFTCTASVVDYSFRLTGNISGARVIGSTRIVVNKGGRLLQQGSAPVRSSSFVAGRKLSVVSQDAHARVEVNATGAGGNSYSGTMAIQSDQGNVNMSTSCVVR